MRFVFHSQKSICKKNKDTHILLHSRQAPEKKNARSVVAFLAHETTPSLNTAATSGATTQTTRSSPPRVYPRFAAKIQATKPFAVTVDSNSAPTIPCATFHCELERLGCRGDDRRRRRGHYFRPYTTSKTTKATTTKTGFLGR